MSWSQEEKSRTFWVESKPRSTVNAMINVMIPVCIDRSMFFSGIPLHRIGCNIHRE